MCSRCCYDAKGHLKEVSHKIGAPFGNAIWLIFDVQRQIVSRRIKR